MPKRNVDQKNLLKKNFKKKICQKILLTKIDFSQQEILPPKNLPTKYFRQFSFLTENKIVGKNLAKIKFFQKIYCQKKFSRKIFFFKFFFPPKELSWVGIQKKITKRSYLTVSAWTEPKLNSSFSVKPQ